MTHPEDILSERIGQYQLRTQLAIDGERPVAFISAASFDPTAGSGASSPEVQGGSRRVAPASPGASPLHDSFDRLMASHRCERCTGSLDRESEQEIEEGTVAGVILAFAVLVLCGVAFTLWMFWAAAAVAP